VRPSCLTAEDDPDQSGNSVKGTSLERDGLCSTPFQKTAGSGQLAAGSEQPTIDD
jgi:hypothetical protein